MNLHTNTRLHNHSMNSTDPRTIMNGNLPAQLDPRNSGLNALWFCEDDITAFLPSWKYPQYAELLSITKVIKLLGHGISTPKEQFPRELFNVSMSKRIFRITESQAQQLLEQYNECTFSPTRTRLLAAYMYGLGHSCGEIMEFTGCSRGLLLTWCYKYKQEGIDGLRDKRRRVTVKPH